MAEYTPAKVGAGIGVFGALFILLTTTLLFIVPQELLSPAASATYIETWSGPIMTIGGYFFTLGLPLACVVSAYYLTTTNHSSKSVAIGFLIGGIAFVIANAVFGVIVTNFYVTGPDIERSLTGHMQNRALDGARLFGAGLIGIAGAVIKQEYF